MENMNGEELIDDNILNELAPAEDATSEGADEPAEEGGEPQEAPKVEGSEEEPAAKDVSEPVTPPPEETAPSEEEKEKEPEEIDETVEGLDIPEPNIPDVLPVPVLIQIQQDAERAVLKEMGLNEMPDPDVEPQKYAQFRRVADAMARHSETIVVQQMKAQREAQRFMIDLGAEKREKFIQFFDGLVMKMAQNPSTALKARMISEAATRGDYVTLFPVMKKVYQAFAMKKGRKPLQPPKTEKPASAPKPKPISEPQTAEELAKAMGYSYPELE